MYNICIIYIVNINQYLLYIRKERKLSNMANDENILIEEIKYQIISNNYTKDQKLPSERNLSDLFSVSRFTLRKALKHLVDIGYLYVKDKSGYFFSGNKININITDPSLFFSLESPNKKTLILKTIKADKKIAKRLNISIQETITQLITLYQFDEDHTSIINAYVYPKIEETENEHVYKIIQSIIECSNEKKGKIYTRDSNEFELNLMMIEESQKVCRWNSTYISPTQKLYLELSLNIQPFEFTGW